MWTDLGESDWSDAAWFEIGLLDAGDWSARWIEPVEPDLPPAGRRPAMLLRGEFELPDVPVARARLHATAHGIYEAFLNGRRVGDAELTPGFTEYRDRLQVQTYDVTGLLRPGRERDRRDPVRRLVPRPGRASARPRPVGDPARPSWPSCARLRRTARTAVAGTGPRAGGARRSHVEAADLIAGQSVDLRRMARRLDASRASTTPAGTTWPSPTTATRGSSTSPAPPVRAVQELDPVSVTPGRGAGRSFDLGQNINGWVRLSDLGPGRHRDHPDARRGPRRRRRRHHRAPRRRPCRSCPSRCRPGQVDRVVSAGRPRRRRSSRGTPRTASSTCASRVIPASCRRRRHAASSCTPTCRAPAGSPAATSASTGCTRRRCGACAATPATSRPTARTRERAGWTGDWQLFVPTAAFLYDVAGFSTKWLRDLAADQWPDGVVANIAPSPPVGVRGRVRWPSLNGSAGWGDAAVIVPWELYRAYGDRRLLEEQWPSMVRVAGSRGARRRGRQASGAGGSSARAAAARALPVGHGLSLGRVARARRGPEGSRRVRGVPARRQGRRRHRLLRPLGAADEPDRRGRRASTPTPGATPSSRIACAPRGRPSSSAPTAA